MREPSGAAGPSGAASQASSPPRLGLGPADVPALPREALPGLLLELAAIQTAVAARLAEPVSDGETAPAANGDRWLRVREIAALMRVSRGEVYSLAKRADWSPFVTRLGPRTLLIGEAGWRAWMARRQETTRGRRRR